MLKLLMWQGTILNSLTGLFLHLEFIKTQSSQAKEFELHNTARNGLDVEVLFMHHRLDKCVVAKLESTAEFFDNLSPMRKSMRSDLGRETTSSTTFV